MHTCMQGPMFALFASADVVNLCIDSCGSASRLDVAY